MNSLKIKDKIPPMVGGRDAIMAKAHELWSPDRASTLSQKDRAKLSADTFLAAIKSNLAAPLTTLIDAHTQAVEDEYVLMEGDAPEDSDVSEEALEWWGGLLEAQRLGLGGDVTNLIGVEAIEKWIRSSEETSALVDLILAKAIVDPANALTACGITQSDIAELALPPETKQPAVDEEMRTPIKGAEHIQGATKSVRHRSPKIAGPNPVTIAAAKAVETIFDFGVTDGDIANALGVSRPHAINYRKGTTLLEPTPDQLGALSALYDNLIDKLSKAIGGLRAAIQAAALE